MFLKNTIITTVIAITMIGCNKAPTTDTELTELKIGDPKIVSDYKLSDYFELLDVTVLDPKKPDVIINVDKLIVKNNKFYLMDMIRTRGVWSFNEDGSYRAKYGESGEGPGEYTEIYDFEPTLDGSEVKVLSFGKYSLYEESSGNHTSDLQLKNEVFKFYETPELYYSVEFHDPESHHLFITDKKQNRLQDYFPFSNKHSFPPLNSFSEQNGELLFHLNLDNTIYALSGEEISPRYKVTFARDSKDVEIPDPMRVFEYLTDFQTVINEFQVTKNFIFFNFMQRGEFYACIYDKVSDKFVVLDKSKFENDLTGSRQFPVFYYSDDEYFYFPVKLENDLALNKLVPDRNPDLLYDFAIAKFSLKSI